MAKVRGGQADWQRQRQAIAREAERARKEAERARVAAEKEAKRQYAEGRAADVERRNRALELTLEGLNTLLSSKLRRSARIDLAAYRAMPTVGPLDLGHDASPVKVPAWEQFAPRPPNALSRIVGGAARYERELDIARDGYEHAVRDAERMEVERQQRVIEAREEHSARVAQARIDAHRRNEAITALVRGIAERKKDDVEEYLRQVLKQLPLPKDFPHEADLTFNPRTEQAVVRFGLPSREVVPTVASYKYLSTKDEVRDTARAKNEVNALYRSVISQVALLCVGTCSTVIPR
jgi:restriction system protein